MAAARNLASMAADAQASLLHTPLHALTFGTVLSRRAVVAESALRILNGHEGQGDAATRAIAQQLRAFDQMVSGAKA
jgi:hypothetical protein